LAAGLYPDPLGELKRSPRPSNPNMGLLLRGREGMGREGGEKRRNEGRGRREGRKWKGREGKE